MNKKRQFITGAVWSVLSTAYVQLFAFVVFMMLVRVLSPEQFGIVAFAALFVELTRPLVNSGIPDALTRYATWDPLLSATAFWLALLSSSIIFLATIILGNQISQALGQGDILILLAPLAFTTFLEGLRCVPEAKMRREFRFPQLARINAVAATSGGIVGVVLAHIGAGVWALIVSRVLTSAVTTLAIMIVARWSPTLKFARNEASYLTRYSVPLVGAQLVAGFNGQVPALIIGALMGPAALGLFNAGTRLIALLTQMVIAPIQRVALTAFSNKNKGTTSAALYIRLVGICSLFACPSFFGIAALAPDITTLLLGSTWIDSSGVMAAGTLAVGALVLNYFLIPSLAAEGNTKDAFRYYALALLLNALFAYLAAPWGIAAVAASQTVRAYLMLPYALRALRNTIGLAPMSALASIAPPFGASLVMAACVAVLRLTLVAHLDSAIALIVLIPLGAVVYGLLLLVFGRSYLVKQAREVMPLLPEPFRRRFGI